MEDKKKLLGKKIQEIRIMSFFINLKKICDELVLYLKTDDNYWFKIIISDGISKIEQLKEEPHLTSLDEIIDEFAYPIKIIDAPYFLGVIVNIEEYLWKGKLGIFIELQGSEGFSIIDKDDCMQIIKGKCFDSL